MFGELIKKVREWEKNEGYTDYYEKDEDSGLEIISIKNSTTIYTYFNELPVSAIDEINEITKKVNWEIEKITATGDGLLCFIFYYGKTVELQNNSTEDKYHLFRLIMERYYQR